MIGMSSAVLHTTLKTGIPSGQSRMGYALHVLLLSFLELPLILSSFMLLLSTLPAFTLAELRAQMLRARDASCPNGGIDASSLKDAPELALGIHHQACPISVKAWMELAWSVGDRLLLLAFMCATVNLAGQLLLNSRKIIGHADRGIPQVSSSAISSQAEQGKGAVCRAKTVATLWKSFLQHTASRLHSWPAAQALFDPINMGSFMHAVELAFVENMLKLRT
jgi:hypothetical protein